MAVIIDRARIPTDQEATLERARDDARALFAAGNRQVLIYRSATRAPGGWGGVIIRFFPLSEAIAAVVRPRADAVVEVLAREG